MAKKETIKKSNVGRKPKKQVTEEVVEVQQTETVALEEAEKAKETTETIVTEEMPKDDKELQKQVLTHVASEILAEKGNDEEEFINTPTEELVEKAKEKIEEIKKINNDRVKTRINNLFGYLWNGQEIDY